MTARHERFGLARDPISPWKGQPELDSNIGKPSTPSIPSFYRLYLLVSQTDHCSIRTNINSPCRIPTATPRLTQSRWRRTVTPRRRNTITTSSGPSRRFRQTGCSFGRSSYVRIPTAHSRTPLTPAIPPRPTLDRWIQSHPVSHGMAAAERQQRRRHPPLGREESPRSSKYR